MGEKFVSFIVITLISMLCTGVVELYIGCSKEERLMVYSMINKLIVKKIHK